MMGIKVRALSFGFGELNAHRLERRLSQMRLGSVYGFGRLGAFRRAWSAIEVASGMSLDRFFQTRIFGPLGMKDTGFHVPAESIDRLMACYARNPDTGVISQADAPGAASRYASAGEVAAELSRFLSGKPVEALGERGSMSPFVLDGANPRLRAYDLFLQALQLHDARGLLAASMREVQDLLHQAVRLDPRLARAHLLLSETHLANFFIGFDPTSARLRQAEEALRTAERLNAEVSEIMRMRAFLLYWGKRDHAAAAAAFAQTVRAMPNSADAHYNLALVHRRMGRFAEAIAGFERARQLDPRNPRIARETAFTLEMVRDYAGALRVFEVQRQAAPHDPELQTHVAMSRLCLDGDVERAIATLAALPADPEGTVGAWRSWLLAWCGRPTEALAWLPPLRARGDVELAEELLHHCRVRRAADEIGRAHV
jgi:CubicO group peptidase (beta-lactamase class C family)